MSKSLLTSAVVIWVYMTVWYLIALIKKRNDIADIAWGLGFLAVGLFNYHAYPFSGWRGALILILVGLWSLRLSGYIYLRNKNKPEDFRYQKWRNEWGKHVIWRSYVQVFLLQGVFLWVVGLPVWTGFSLNSSEHFSILDFLGILIWLVGFLFESVSDWQMDQFRKNRSREGQVMTSGLWRYSRHPNYFGEALLWWGIFVVSFSGGSPFWVLVGPAMITFLLVKVSGVPMLEAKYKKNEAYRVYQDSTSAFIPWFPRRKRARS